MSDMQITSKRLQGFFDAEIRNYRENVRNGNIDPTDGFHPTLASALDTLSQAPESVTLEWFDLTDGQVEMDETLAIMCGEIMGLAFLIVQHGPDAKLIDFEFSE